MAKLLRNMIYLIILFSIYKNYTNNTNVPLRLNDNISKKLNNINLYAKCPYNKWGILNNPMVSNITNYENCINDIPLNRKSSIAKYEYLGIVYDDSTPKGYYRCMIIYNPNCNPCEPNKCNLTNLPE